jgi:hypothetical protein
MNTGTAKRPVNNKPAADGTCPSGESLCGTGVFAICVDLENDWRHCGACDRLCSPGIACQGGTCQQTLCATATMPFSGEPTSAATSTSTATSTSILGQVPGGLTFTGNQILADVDGDGLLDRVEWVSSGEICQSCSVDLSEFSVSLGQGSGRFAPPDTYRASAAINSIFVVDVNGDGLADLYVSSSSFQNSAIYPYHLELWLGQRDGHLLKSEAAGMSTDGMGGWGLAVGDISGDGWPDLVLSTADANLDDPPKISVYLSDSTGALHLSQTFVVASESFTFIRDWNGDGSPDLALVYDGLQILYNRGDGTFEAPVDCAVWLQGEGFQDLLVQDFNRDGRMDIAPPDMGKRVGILLGLGGCGFAPIAYYDLPESSSEILRAADMNGDGILDIVSLSAVYVPDPRVPDGFSFVIADNLLAVLLGKPDGTFQLQDPVISLGPNVTDMTIGEVTGDQRPDIVVSSVDGTTAQVSTLENTCQ